MKNFVLKNLDLHSTKGAKRFYPTKHILASAQRVIFSKKSNMWIYYLHHNKTKNTDIMEYFNTREEAERRYGATAYSR